MTTISITALRSSIITRLLCGVSLTSLAARAQSTDDVPRPLEPLTASSSGVSVDGASASSARNEVAEVVVTVERAAAARSLRATQAGSVATVTADELDRQKASNLGEVLARIPGVLYVDEDGRGTKPDIGLRGLNPIRSEYVQLLADGVPTQPSMY